MTQNEQAARPHLQTFLEDTISLLGQGLVLASNPATVRLLLPLWQHGKTPEEAAAHFKRAYQARAEADFDADLKDAFDGLRSRAYSTEQEVRKISERLTESMCSDGPVKGLLNVSHPAQGLVRLRGMLTVYEGFNTLLNIFYEETQSAELALGMAKEEAVARLVDMNEAERHSEGAGALEALKNVIKIVTNTL
jgi:hypothetical protein